VSSYFTDTQLHRLMTGPDSLYVERDQLMDEKDVCIYM
jgi:hypothetical protein